MGFFGPTASDSVKALNQAIRRQSAKMDEARKPKKPDKTTAPDDEVILHPEAIDAARDLTNNNEEAQEDRQEHDNYNTPHEDPPHLDLQA